MAILRKPKTHVFIDTNVFLDFFAFAKDDLKELEKLIKLIDGKYVTLYMTRQVVDEFQRNREKELSISIAGFQPIKDAGCPKFIRSVDAYEEYDEALSSLKKAFDVLSKRTRDLAASNGLPADVIFNKIVDASGVIEFEDEMYLRAIRRNRIGNPPGKDNYKVGDEINWETLLEKVKEKADIHIISRDGDYFSDLNSMECKGFLVSEWSEKKNGKLYIYKTIGDFFAKNYPGEDFILEAEKRETVDCLIRSDSFQATHVAINMANRFISLFNEEEVEEVIQGCLSNSQIAWIVSDADVESFLSQMLSKHGNRLSVSLRSRLEEALGVDQNRSRINSEDMSNVIDADDIPF